MPETVVTTPDGSEITVIHPAGATQQEIIAYAQSTYKPSAGLGKQAVGLGTDVAIAEGSRLTGSAIGTAILPGIGTGVGYVIGGLGGGAAGSIARQRIVDPNGDISWGEVIADSFINLIPGSKAVKGASTGAKLLKSGAKGAAYGAGIGAGGKVVEDLIDDKELPTWDELTSRGLTAAVLGGALGMSGQAAEQLYRKYAGMKARDFTAAITGGDKDAEMLVGAVKTTAGKQREAVQNAYEHKLTKLNEIFADQHAELLKLQDQSGGGQRFNKNGVLKVVRDDADYYMQSRLAHGKIQTKQKKIADQERIDNEFLIEKAEVLGVDAQSLSMKVDDYLKAKHAPAFNEGKYDGAAGKGFTNKESKAIVSNFEKAGLNEELATSINIRKQQSRQILDELVEGGLIAEDVALSWRKKSPDYVPLTRIIDEADDEFIGALSRQHGVGKEVKSTGVFKAKGSELDTHPIRENIYNSLVSAIKKSETNKANIAFKKLLESNPGQEIAKVEKFNPKFGKEDMVGSVFENGIHYGIKFKDPNVAAAFKGTNKEELGVIMKGMRAINRFRGKTLTLWNPLGFTIPNVTRDRSDAFVNALAKMDIKNAAQTLNPLRAGSDMWVVANKLANRKPVTDSEKALFKLYDDFKAHGGSTGGLALETIKDVEKEITALAKHLNSPLRRQASKFNEVLAKINEVAEDSTRFGAYRQALDSGMTKDQAAMAARDSSFDPMLRGLSDSLSALYLFANPAVQSSKNFLRSMSKPKVGASVMAGLVGINMAIDKWNSSYDENWREKLKDSRGGNWKNNKHLLIVHGTNDDGTLKYLSIPIGYSMVPFKVAADKLQLMARGKETGSAADVSKELAGEILDSYNPTGGSLIPTVLQPVYELSKNVDSLGRIIRPWEDILADKTEKVFPTTAETFGGEVAMSLAETLKDMGMETSPENLMYLFEHYTGGTGTEIRRLMDVSSKMFNGEDIKKNDIPTLRRFFGDTWANAWEERTGYENIMALEKQEGTTMVKSNRVAESIAKKVQAAGSPEEKRAVLQASIVGNPEINQAVIRSLENKLTNIALGVTYTDRARKNLGVKNLARALSYVQTFEQMDKESIPKYLQDQRRKRILTPEVEQQIVSMERFRNLVQQQ